jgi:predicted nucleic acid-binding protein
MFLDALSKVDISVYEAANVLSGIRHCADWAKRSNLTAYDASYVELAAREGLRLATLDRRVTEAARSIGVTMFTP